MSYLIKMVNGRYQLSREVNKRVFVVKSFDSLSEAKKVRDAYDMVASVWCYDGDLKNEYLQKYIEQIGIGPIKEEYEWYEKNCESVYSGTDSEGVTYNRIILKGFVEQPKEEGIKLYALAERTGAGDEFLSVDYDKDNLSFQKENEYVGDLVIYEITPKQYIEALHYLDYDVDFELAELIDKLLNKQERR